MWFRKSIYTKCKGAETLITLITALTSPCKTITQAAQSVYFGGKNSTFVYTV
jgi:hypothetical protein